MKITGSKDMAALKAAAVIEANTAIGQIRAKYITIAPGQETIYAAKEAEALRYLAEFPGAEDEPEVLEGYPFLTAEIGITEPTAFLLANLWKYKAADFREIGANLESHRQLVISEFNEAPTPAKLEELLGRLRETVQMYLAG